MQWVLHALRISVPSHTDAMAGMTVAGGGGGGGYDDDVFVPDWVMDVPTVTGSQVRGGRA